MHLLSNLLNFHTVGIPKGKDRPAAKATDTNKKMSHSHFHASPHQKKHNEYSQHFLSPFFLGGRGWQLHHLIPL